MPRLHETGLRRTLQLSHGINQHPSILQSAVWISGMVLIFAESKAGF